MNHFDKTKKYIITKKIVNASKLSFLDKFLRGKTGQ